MVAESYTELCHEFRLTRMIIFETLLKRASFFEQLGLGTQNFSILDYHNITNFQKGNQNHVLTNVLREIG